MPQPDSHTRLIGWLKIVLPLLALALLSTLFLVARTINPEDAVPYADIDVEDRLRAPRMTAPTYAGLTEDGASLTFSADEARPEAGNVEGSGFGSGNATALIGLLETPDGARTDLSAGLAQIDDPARQVRLSEGVTVVSSAGWTVQSDKMTAAMDVTDITTEAPVTAKGPGGVVTAESMRLQASKEKPGAYLLVFNGNVKLIYQPAS